MRWQFSLDKTQDATGAAAIAEEADGRGQAEKADGGGQAEEADGGGQAEEADGGGQAEEADGRGQAEEADGGGQAEEADSGGQAEGASSGDQVEEADSGVVKASSNEGRRHARLKAMRDRVQDQLTLLDQKQEQVAAMLHDEYASIPGYIRHSPHP